MMGFKAVHVSSATKTGGNSEKLYHTHCCESLGATAKTILKLATKRIIYVYTYIYMYTHTYILTYRLEIYKYILGLKLTYLYAGLKSTYI